MPLYEFEDKKGDKKEFLFSMKNAPKIGAWVTIEGKKWKRLTPSRLNAMVDANVDPFNERKFLEKTGTGTKGKVGDLWARSEELSNKRAAKRNGVDPVKERFYKEYSGKRRGVPHPTQIQEKTFEI